MTIVIFVLVVIALVWVIVFYDNGFGGFEYESARPRADEQHADGAISTVHFPAADGSNIEGWLFMPTEKFDYPLPLIIMAPGLTGLKEGPLEKFAWYFVQQGFAVLSFDFRSFGGSDGEPRHWVDPFRQVEDYQAAIGFARQLPKMHDNQMARRIDSKCIVLWGSSFSAGSALMAASESTSIAAVIAQCPFLRTSPELEPPGKAILLYALWVVLDQVRYWLSQRLPLTYRPVYIPVFGQPGEFVFAASRDNPSCKDPAKRGSPFWQNLPMSPRGGWQNKMLVRFLADFDKFKPMNGISKIKCAIYLIAAESDDMVPKAFVDEAMRQARHPQSRKHVFSCGHFDLYTEPIFQENVEKQVRFLKAIMPTDGDDAEVARRY